MTQVTTIDTNNFAAMAQAMGIASEANKKEKSSSLPRLRINHAPIMGTADVNGKKVNMEVVPGGTYKLEIPDGPTYYAESVNIRTFLQRFMYKKFVKGHGDTPNQFVKTLMADSLNIDLKDNSGGFNCGKPAGYIQDFKALPEKTQELIKQIKRVRVLMGTVELINPTDEKGNPVDITTSSFIWEIDNRDAFKTYGDILAKLTKMQRLPVQHNIESGTEERKLPNGSSFFLPTVSVDATKTIELSEADQQLFSDFMAWVDNYNTYIVNTWAKKANAHMEDDDVDVVDDIVDIDIDEEEVA